MSPLFREILEMVGMVAGTSTMLIGLYKLLLRVIESNEKIKLDKTIGVNTVRELQASHKDLQVSHEFCNRRIGQLEDEVKKGKFEIDNMKIENEHFREKALDTLHRAYELVMNK